MTRPIVRQLDAKLFERTKWFVIDANQNKLGDVPTLDRGLTLTSRGDAAAVVGRLAPGVAVIDVDAGGIEGDAITENLIGWLVGRGRWHLVRPSGGDHGRNHVYCVPGADEADLASFVADLRIAYGLPAVKIDHRGAGGASPWLRPLSSPHRRTGLVPPPLATPQELHQALQELAGILQRRTADKTTARARKATAAAGRQAVALEPLPRRRKDIEPRWASWIAGAGPAPLIGGGDQSRSGVELAGTTVLLRAGLRSEDAWNVIRDANGDAFAKARTRGHSWWIRMQWNTAVRSDTTWHEANKSDPSAGGGVQAGPETVAAVVAARADLQHLQWLWGSRERHSIILVAHTLLDRMVREDNLAVPCPLRNLEEDTGLARNTILAALAALEDRLGNRIAAFDRTRAESSSHVFELSGRYSEAPLSLDEPPGTTPTHRHPPGRWASLTPTAHTLWRQLPSGTDPELPPEVLARRSGLTHAAGAPPTTRQLRTLRARLDELEGAGLASRSPAGLWQRSERGNRFSERMAAATYSRLHARITKERAEYRSGRWNVWSRGRLRVLRRSRQRQQQWWSLLPENERRVRRRDLSAAYSALPQVEQAKRRGVIALTRHRAGEPAEREVHAAWCRRFDRETQADRSAEWQARFVSLPPAERVARERLLEEHRRQWHLPASWSTSGALRGVDIQDEALAAA